MQSVELEPKISAMRIIRRIFTPICQLFLFYLLKTGFATSASDFTKSFLSTDAADKCPHDVNSDFGSEEQPNFLSRYKLHFYVII